MTEHNNPINELIYSYGEEPIEVTEVVSEYPEQIEVEETINQDENNFLFLAQEYMRNYSDEERITADEVVSSQNEISKFLESEDPVKKRNAFYASFGSLLSGMPTSEKEKENLSLEKRLLSGAILRGAQTATLAVALMMPMLAQSKDKKPEKSKENKEAPAPVLSSEDRAIQKMGDNIFGKDFLGIKEDRKEWYMAMEKEKRGLYERLDDESRIAPRSEEEKSMFKLIEAKRDRQLAEIKIQEIKLSKESMKANLSDPEIVALIESRSASLIEAKAKVIHDFESEIKKAYVRRKGSEKNSFIRDRINEIERDQKRLVRSEISRTNSYYHSGWTY